MFTVPNTTQLRNCGHILTITLLPFQIFIVDIYTLPFNSLHEYNFGIIITVIISSMLFF